MKERLISVDIFRGITIMLMTIVNNPGSWNAIYPPLEHASWHGCTPTDLVFPFFLFVVGVSTVLAAKEPKSLKHNILKISVRGLRIFALGLFLNFYSKIHLFGLEGYGLMTVRLLITAFVFYLLLTDYDRKKQLYAVLALLLIMFGLAYGSGSFSTVRLPGVLQRIAIVYFIAAVLYQKFEWKALAGIAAFLLLAYWAAMALIPINGETGNFEAGKNVAAAFDRIFLENHMWVSTKTWDPEGLFSTIPAIATALIGIFIGQLLVQAKNNSERLNQMMYLGLGMVVIAFLWDKVFPINKALWTSSYVLHTAGLASLALALIQMAVDQFGSGKWTKPFLTFGVNPMLVFFFSGILPRVWSNIKIGDSSFQPYIYEQILVPLFSQPKMASLSWAILYLVFWYLILVWFYAKKVIVKV